VNTAKSTRTTCKKINGDYFNIIIMHRITGDDSYIADTRHKSAATYLSTQQIFTAHETCRSLLVLCSNGHFSRWTWISRYHNVSILDFIGAKDDGDGGDNWSYKACKAPVKSSPPTNRHPTFYRPDALPVTQPTVSKH